MKNSLSRAMLLFLLTISYGASKAQVASPNYIFTANSVAYTPITGGTVLGTSDQDDDAFASSIPFPFTFRGIVYNNFGVTTNGFIRFGAGAPNITYSPISDAFGDNNIASGLGTDLLAGINITGNITSGSNIITGISSNASLIVGAPVYDDFAYFPAGTTITSFTATTITVSAPATGTQTGSGIYVASGEIRVQTTGTSPNRIRIVQWSRFMRYGGYVNEVINFQIRLYETTNVIEVAYGTFSIDATAVELPEVGLRGSSTSDFNNRSVTNNAASTWAASAAGAVNTATCRLSSTKFPASGQRYLWTPPAPAAIDLMANLLVSPASTGCFGTGQTVIVQIRNNGTGPINFATSPATISGNVTGPNPQTFTPVTINTGTLPVSGTQNVTLSANYNMSVNGVYTFNLTATAAGDGNTLNNTLSPAPSVTVSRQTTFPHVVGFDVIPSPSWLITSTTVNNEWVVDITGNSLTSGLLPVLDPGIAYFNSYSFAPGDSSRLISPCYDMSTLNNPAIDIWFAQDNLYPSNDDRVDILISTNGGLTWSAPLQTLHLYDATATTPFWKKYTITLTGYSNNSSVRIALQAISEFGSDIGIDRLKVYDLPQFDPEPVAIVNPTTNSCHSSADQLQVTLKNNGYAAINLATTPITITANVSGASTQSFTYIANTGTIPASGSTTVTVTSLLNMSVNGTHNFQINLTMAGDGDLSNNSIVQSVQIADITVFPWLETFDNGQFGWTSAITNNPGYAIDWSFTDYMYTPLIAPYSGDTCAEFSYASDPGTEARLYTPCIHMPASGSPILEFYMTRDDEYTENDSLRVFASVDNGVTWTRLGAFRRYGAAFTVPTWQAKRICIDSYVGQNLLLAFEGYCFGNGNSIGLDNVSIYDASAVSGTISSTTAAVFCGSSSDTLTLTGYTGTSISWQQSLLPAGPWSNIANSNNDSLSTGLLSVTTYYRAVVTNQLGCINRDTTASFAVTINTLPTVTLGADTSVCGSLVLDAGNISSAFLWSTGATSQTITATVSGIYIAEVTNAQGCTSSDTIAVTVNAIPVVNLGNDTTLCASQYVLDAANQGASYSWNTAATTQAITINNSGNYFVQVTNAQNCSSADTIQLTLNTPPAAALGSDTAVCANNYLLDAGNNATAYLWNTGDTTQTIAVNASGVYSVTVSNSPSCIATDTIQIILNSAPVVNLGSDTATCNFPYLLDAGNTGNQFLWNTGATTQTISASAAGSYNVTVTSPNGCTTSDTIQISASTLAVTYNAAQLLFCVSDGPALLSGGVPAGGTYSGPGVSGSQFSPSTAGLGISTVTYTYIDSSGCQGQATVQLTVDACVGINTSETSPINVYPNPVNDVLIIQSALPVNSACMITVYSTDGRKIQEENYPAGSNTELKINTSNWNSGIYFVKIENSGIHSIFKVVKQ